MHLAQAVYAPLHSETRVLSSFDDKRRLIRRGGTGAAFQENRMNSNRTLVRWGALALLVTLMSGCCVAPWGGRYYGGERYYHGGGYEHGGYSRDGGGWHH
jgi:hypothetical protein